MAYSSEFTRKVLSENKKKKEEYSSDFTKSVLNNTYKPSANDYKKVYKQSQENLRAESSNLKSMYNNAGIVMNNNGYLPSYNKTTFYNEAINPQNYDNNKISNTKVGAAALHDVLAKEKANSEKYNTFKNQKEVIEQTKKVNDAYDDTAIDYYNYLQKKADEHEVNLYDKTLGRAVGGLTSVFDTGLYSLKNEKGEKYIMPTYNDLKNQKVSASYKTGVGKFLGDATFELGRQASSAGLNAIIPGAGTTAYFGSMFTDNWNNAIKEGYDSDKSLVYATLGTGLEVATGKLLGGTTKAVFGTGTSELSEAISKGLSKVITNHPRLVTALSNAISEGGEEFIQEYLDRVNKKLTLGSKDKILTKETFNDAIYSAAVGMVTGGVNGAINPNAYSSRESSLLTQIDENQNNINSLTEKRNNNLANINKVNKIDNQIANSHNNINKLNNELSNYYQSKNQINLPGIENAISNKVKSKEKNSATASDALSPRSLTSETDSGTSSFSINNDTIKTDKGQITSLPNIMLNNNDNMQDINLPGISKYSQESNSNIFTYETSDNTKINNLRKSASNYFNNSEQAHNFVNTIEKIVSDKNYNIIFDDSISNQNGNQINAKIETLVNGETQIKINPNSPRSGEFLIMHEVTHAIETENMKKLVLDYASKHSDFNQALKSLKQTYGTNEVSSEIVADISGQLFGNQEFINNLSMKQPNIFKRIYNSIISFANKITGNSHEALFIKDLKSKWENAYRTQGNNLKTEYLYSQQILKDGTTYVRTENNLFNHDDGTPMTQREIYNSLIGKEITFNDGIIAKIEGWLPGNKNMYNELFKRYPNYKNVDDIKSVNKSINENIVELLENSNNISPNEPDYKNRHKNNKITSFDTRTVGFYDGTNAYNLDFSIAKLQDGKYVAYAKRNLLKNNDLLNKIKKEAPMSKSQGVLPYDNTLSQNSDKVNLPNKYSMQNNENNTNWQSYIEKNYKSTGTKTNMQDIKLPFVKNDNTTNDNTINLPISEDVKMQNIKLPNAKETIKTDIENKINKKMRNRNYKIANEATKTAQQYINFDRMEKQSFKEELLKYSNKTKDEIQNAKTYQEVKQIVEKYADREVNFINNEIASIKNEIRNYKIKVNEYIKENIDYNEFRQNNFGKLKLGNDGINIDSAWQELSSMYPEYFDKNINNEFDMLQTLSDFMNESSVVTENYRLSDFEINSATNRILDKLIKNSLTEQEINEMQAYLEDKYNIRTREMVQQEILKEMNIKIEDLDIGEDIGSLAYQRTDPIRLNEKVFGAKIGKKINDATINQTKHNEAERTRFLNKEREEIKALGIKAYSKESAAVQKYAEKSYIGTDGKKYSYGDLELQSEFKDASTQEKIKNVADILRNKYDTYIDNINEVITSLGYDAIPKRKDYMHHFQELDSKFAEWGLPLSNLNDENLPTDINGLTDQFKPGKNYFAAAMERKGMKTVYDAITGVDKYLEGASNLIYHTKDIQRYRALSKLIRDTYGQNHGMDNMNKFTAEQFNQRLDDIYNGKLSKYVAWLDEQANALAGKKGAIDRGAERVLGRKIYTVLDTAKKQVGSNMTGFNVRSALTNFASAIQGASKTNKIAFLKGTISTFKNIIHNDGLINKSDFLTSRFGSKQLSQKLWQKASNAGQILMSGSDYFTSNQIWRSKYYENLQKGMTEKQAIKNADDFSARIMGDRSKGTTAEIFNSKTLGLITQFQLEVNNQWSSMIHDNKIDIELGNKTKASILFQVGQLAAASYLFNNLMKSLTGASVMFDPIDMLKKLLGLDDDDEEKSLDKRAFEVFGDFMDNVPMASIFTGGRIPISEAFTGATTTFKKITNQKDEYGNDITYKDVGNDLIFSAFYWLLPTGYGQIKKTVKGTSMYDKNLPMAGSYTNSGNLRFNADESTSGKIKAVLFGQYSSEEAQKYVDSGYKSINKNNIKEMKELGISSSEYRDYRDGLSKAGKKVIDKTSYINSLDLDYNKKNIMLSNILYDDKTKDKLKAVNDLKMSELDKNIYFTAQAKISEIKSDKNNNNQKKEISKVIINTNLSDKYMAHLYGYYYSDEETLNNLVTMKIPIKEYIKLNSEEFTSDYYSSNGKSISGSKKAKVINYINSLNLSIPQKAILIKSQYSTYKNYDKEIFNYVNKINISANEKKVLLKSIGFKNYNKDVINYINSQNLSIKDKEKKLKSLGFTVRNGRVYS